jgi:hypothetical protein
MQVEWLAKQMMVNVAMHRHLQVDALLIAGTHACRIRLYSFSGGWRQMAAMDKY